MKALEPTINSRICIKMFKKYVADQEAGDGDENALQTDSVVKIMIKHKIGGYGNFVFGKYLEERRARYKENKKLRKKV